MSWMSELSKLYDLEADIIGEDIDGKTLLPVYHSTQKAQIDVFLYDDASFAYGKAVDESDSVTIIPTTEDSSTRSSGIAPHPLCDKLVYVAGDYSDHVKGAKKNIAAYFEAYIRQLSGWVQSAYSDRLIRTVYDYLRRGTLIADLLQCDVLKAAENSRFLDESYKVAKIAQSDCFVRFTVINRADGTAEDVWHSKRLYDRYIAYYDSIDSQNALCYVTGETLPVTYKHSAKIRNSGDKAKLLSSNDSTNYTYRGRFSNDAEAYAVSREVSQKAHLALRWLIERQGTTVDTAKFVIWESELQPVIDAAQPFDLWELFEDDELLPKTNREYGRAVAKYIKGRQHRADSRSCSIRNLPPRTITTISNSGTVTRHGTRFGSVTASVFTASQRRRHIRSRCSPGVRNVPTPEKSWRTTNR